MEQFEALQKEKQDLYDRLLRKQAEFDNFRKRTEKEKIESYDFAVANFILGLLPALDGLERGLSVTEGETVESYKRGIELILKQLRDQLASAGVQPIRVTGKMFDPNFHQAVMREESASLAGERDHRRNAARLHVQRPLVAAFDGEGGRRTGSGPGGRT